MGTAEPAFAQIMSGGVPLFQAVASDRMRAFSAGEVTSAEIAWNLWRAGVLADACAAGVSD